MKTSRFKFDALWRQAICIASLNDEEKAVQYVVSYLEQDCTPYPAEELEAAFRPVWTLIKAEIDRRKRRNYLARERRRRHRTTATSKPGLQRSNSAATSSAKPANSPTLSIDPSTRTTAQGRTTVTREIKNGIGDIEVRSRNNDFKTVDTVAHAQFVREHAISQRVAGNVDQPVARLSRSERRQIAASILPRFTDRFRGPAIRSRK